MAADASTDGSAAPQRPSGVLPVGIAAGGALVLGCRFDERDVERAYQKAANEHADVVRLPSEPW